MAKNTNKYIPISPVKVKSFVLLSWLECYKLSVFAECNMEMKSFECFGFTPKICMDEMESVIGLYFGTLFEFDNNDIIFSLN
jgi:hypothetical protein